LNNIVTLKWGSLNFKVIENGTMHIRQLGYGFLYRLS